MATGTDLRAPFPHVLQVFSSTEDRRTRHIHVVQLANPSARVLNRTLVLPNVGKSGVGFCHRCRFRVYYDERALSSKLDGDNSSCFIQQQRLKAQVEYLGHPPASQRFCGPDLSQEFSVLLSSPTRDHCFLGLRVTSLPHSMQAMKLFLVKSQPIACVQKLGHDKNNTQSNPCGAVNVMWTRGVCL